MMRKLSFMISLLMLLVVVGCVSTSVAEDVHHTITFHSGADGIFETDSTENVVEYGAPTGVSATKYSHTSNINDAGVASGSYAQGLNTNDVVTIPGATSLQVSIKYDGYEVYHDQGWNSYYEDQDWACVWKNSHPEYRASTHYEYYGVTDRVSGKLCTSGSPMTATYNVESDTVTFGFYSKRAYSHGSYGYYAVITSKANPVVLSDNYLIPNALNDDYVFDHWNTQPDGSGEDIDNLGDITSDTDLYAVYVDGTLGSGTYRNVHWKLNRHGILLLGSEGSEETFEYVETQSGSAWPWYNLNSKIVGVKFIGSVNGNGSMASMFYNCSNLTNIEMDNFDVSLVTNISSMFGYCSKLSVVDVSNWDTGNMAYMSSAFYYCRALSELDLSNWKFTNVMSVSSMFYYCSSLSSVRFGDAVSSDNLTNMSSMFSGCSMLVNIDLSMFDVQNVTGMSSMFSSCTSLQNVDVHLWQCNSVTNMSYMFSGCSKLSSVDFSGVVVPGVLNVSYMFAGCSQLSYLDISGFDFSNVTSSDSMYQNCSALAKFTFGDNNPVVCANGAYIALPMGWSYFLENSDPMVGPYSSEELVAEYTADNAGVWVSYELTYKVYAVFDDSDNTLYFIRMLDSDYVESADPQTVHSLSGESFTGVIYPANEVGSRSVQSWNEVVSSVEHVVCADRVVLQDASHDWFTSMSNCIDMDVSLVDVSMVTNFSNMFANCSSLTELNLSTWDDSLATNVSYMFSNCSSLQTLDISGFTFKRRPGNSSLFAGCSSLEELDISGFDGNPTTSYYTYVIDYSPLNSLSRIHLGIYPGRGSVFGAPQNWVREDKEYGPYPAVTFAQEYNYYDSSATDENKAKAGWYVRDESNGVVVAILCFDDNNTLYFLKTTDCCGDKVNGTIHRVDDDRVYIGRTYWLPSGSATPSWASDKYTIRNVVALDAFKPDGSMLEWFYQYPYLNNVDLSLVDVSDVTNMKYCFYGTRASGTVNLKGWKLNSDPVMDYMFCESRITTLDLTGWDVSECTKVMDIFQRFNGHLIAPDFHWDKLSSGTSYSSLPNMFWNCGNDTFTVFDIPRWSFGAMTDLSQMFYYSYSDVHAPDWNLDGVTTIHNMFRGSNRQDKSQKIDISGWHSNTLTSAYNLFVYSYGLMQVNISDWDMPALSVVSGMFNYDEYLKSIIGLETWKSTRSITNFDWMFGYCSVLSSVDLSTWDVPGVLTCDGMFCNCPKITSIDLSGFNISGVTNFSSMFRDCTNLEYLDISGLDASSATNMSLMFDGCPNLQKVVLGDVNAFQGSGSTYANLPTPQYNYRGEAYSGKWIREDGMYGPFAPDALRQNYRQYMAGTWVWDQGGETSYTIIFEAPDGSIGSMAPFTAPESNIGYQLPANRFRRPGATFVRWRDNIKNYIYSDRSYVSGYEPGSVVVFTAEFSGDGGEAVNMEDGSFTFTLKKNQTAFFDGLPVNTIYQVYEETPSGWALIAQRDSSGIIQSTTESTARFTNGYVKNKCSLILSGDKFFDTELASAGQFQFELLDEDGNVVSTAVNGEGGMIVFDSLVFTDADIGKEIYYTIREVLPDSDSSIGVAMDSAYKYDAHEERVRVIVSYKIKEDGALYSGTSNFNGDGERLKAIRTLKEPLVSYYYSTNLNESGKRIGSMDTVVYSHTSNIDDNGVKLEDYQNYKYYTDVVTIPHATQLKVKLKYSNPRGNFWIWRGAHDGVHTQSYTSDFSPSTAILSYPSQYNYDDVCLTDEFIVDGDSLTVLWYSSTLSSTSSKYTEESNYGYYMEVTPLAFDTSDYLQKPYGSLIRIPGAAKMHVKVQYSNPRGENSFFGFWNGYHTEVRTGTWSNTCNLSNALYSFSGENSSELSIQEFDVVGDALSVFYYSTPLSDDDPDYTVYSNYGYHITVTVTDMVNANSVRPDGSVVSDYMSNQLASDVVTIPGAESLHVELTYSTPRGYFYVWDGRHSEVSAGTSGFNADFNNNTALKTYSYNSADEGVLLTDSFDVDGDSLSVMYYSYAMPLSATTPAYNDNSNYGYLMKITPVNLSGADVNYTTYRSTPNVSADGVQYGSYTKGKDYVEVVSIPGATALSFRIMFDMGNRDGLKLFAGNHPEYKYDTYASSVTTLTGSTSYYYVYTVPGDTATLIFHADADSTGGTGYGYYAIIQSVTSISELRAEAIYDNDGMTFYNDKAIGYLTLDKLSTDSKYSGGPFMFELSFVDDHGNPTDIQEDIDYHADTTVLPESMLTVYHMGLNHDGSEYGILSTDRYQKAKPGDTIVVKSKNIDYFAYARNSYTNTNEDSISCVVGEDPMTVYMYYDALPHLLRVKHQLVDTNDLAVGVREVEDFYFYAGDEIILEPKQYSDYVYVKNTYDLVAGSDLRGQAMPDEDIVILLKYRTVRTAKFVQKDYGVERAYRAALPENYTGLTTARFGDFEFVDGVAEIRLTDDEANSKVLSLPYNTTITILPGEDDGLGNVRTHYGNLYDAFVYTNPDFVVLSFNRPNVWNAEFYGSPIRKVTFKRVCVSATGTESDYNSTTKSMFAGDVVGNLNCKLNDSMYNYNLSAYYHYLGQDVDPNTVVADEDITVVQRYGIRRQVTVQYIKVSRTGTESIAGSRTYYFGAYGDFSISPTWYSGYTFDSAICSSDNTIVLSGTDPITGTLKGDHITIQLRYRQN